MATNFVTASYQEVYDLSNQSGEVSVLGIRTPTTDVPRKMLRGFFNQFRKFRYYGCEVRVQPASMLPADPLQIGLEAGETIDPRDLLNPILFHGCHGDDLNYALNMIYQNGRITPVPASSIDEYKVDMDKYFPRGESGSIKMEQVYYSCLSDRSWRKFGVQQPFRLRLRPLVHQVVMNQSFLPTVSATGDDRGTLVYDSTDGVFDIEAGNSEYVLGPGGDVSQIINPATQLFTNRLTSLGWLDCRRSRVTSDGSSASNEAVAIPKCFMGILLLPPSYRQEMYMRVVIIHRFGFKDFTSSLNWELPNQVFGNLPDSATSEASAMSLESPSANIVQTTSGVF